jgi:DHA2 family multidrug resistance protein
VALCFATAIALLGIAILRPRPAIHFHLLGDRALAFGCALSFLFGFLLFSSVYVLPVFLAFVRGHGPLAIGLITVVMGLTQIIAAPIVVAIDRHFDARWLTALGFAAFAAGLAMNAGLTVNADYDEVFWPQILRGAVVMFCVLPTIRLALGLQPLSQVNDASGLFNVVRNVGGAIGIAIMDTVMFTRGPHHAESLTDLARSDPQAAAAAMGIAVEDIPAADDAMGFLTFLETLEPASLTLAINECFWLLAVTSLLALPLLWWLGPVDSAKPVKAAAPATQEQNR